MNATKYEVINKVTEEVTAVENYEAGNETVTVHLPDGTPIVFSNIGNVGDLQNDTYAIREVATHSQADGTGTVEVTEAGVENVDTPLPEFGEFEMPTPNTPVAENIDTTTETVAEPVVETAPTE